MALDVLPMDPLAGVHFIRGDFREQGVLDALREAVGDAPVDLVMSDMAPNLRGIDVVDQARGMHLAELALDLALETLGPEGVLVTKVFQGAGFDELLSTARSRFAGVRLRKPGASWKRSAETYLLARNPRT